MIPQRSDGVVVCLRVLSVDVAGKVLSGKALSRNNDLFIGSGANGYNNVKIRRRLHAMKAACKATLW